MKDNGQVTLRSPDAGGRWLSLMLMVSLLLTMDCPTVQSSRVARISHFRKIPAGRPPFPLSPKHLNYLLLDFLERIPTANSKRPVWINPLSWSHHHHLHFHRHFFRHGSTAHRKTPAWVRKLFWSCHDLKYFLQFLKLIQAVEKPTAWKKPTTVKPPTEKPTTEKPTTEKPTTEVPGSGNLFDKHSNLVYQLTHSMDRSVSPCHDFYQYTCGNCHLSHNAKEGGTLGNLVRYRLKDLLEKPYDSATEGLYIKTTKDLYQSCVDEDQLRRLGGEPVRSLLRETLHMQPRMMSFGESPPPSFSLEATLVKMAYVGVVPFFKVRVDADAHDNTKQIVWVNPGKLGLSRQYLVLGPTSLEVITYREWCYHLVVNVLGLEPSRALNASISEALDFELDLAQFYPRSVKDSSVSSGNHMTYLLSEMDIAYPNFNWTDYLKLFFHKSKVKLPSNLTISVHHKFVRNVAAVLARTDRRVLANYLVLRVVRSSYPYLNKEIRDLDIPIRTVLFGMNHSVVHWQSCVSLMTKTMMNAVSSMYVTRYFSPQAKQKAIDVVEFIRDAMQEVISLSRWIDNATKAKALEKSEKLTANVGYPDYLLNKTYLETMYKKVVFDPKALYQNMMHVSFSSTSGNARALLRPVLTREKWIVPATDVNAYYDSTSNVMFCPAAILQPPYFGDEFPMAMIFGAIGMVISHELTHAFDDQGRKFDEEGNKASWWTKASKQKFDQQAQCFVNQFSNIVYYGHRINGNATLSENIADNGGAKIAFRAFMKWQAQKGPEEPLLLPNVTFTPEQLFFVSLSQMWCNVITVEQAKASVLMHDHSPNSIRANMVMSNSRNFSQAFNCRPGSTMNPPDKCQLW